MLSDTATSWLKIRIAISLLETCLYQCELAYHLVHRGVVEFLVCLYQCELVYHLVRHGARRKALFPSKWNLISGLLEDFLSDLSKFNQ